MRTVFLSICFVFLSACSDVSTTEEKFPMREVSPQLPKPSGPHQVGVMNFELIDASRPPDLRRMMTSELTREQVKTGLQAK